MVHYFIQYMECPLWAGTVLGAGDTRLPQTWACLRGTKAKKYLTHVSTRVVTGTSPGSHSGGGPNTLEGQKHSPKGSGPEQGLAGYTGAGWERFSGVVSVAPMEPQTRIAVLSKDHF